MSEIDSQLQALAGASKDSPNPATGAKRILSALSHPEHHADFRKLRGAVARHRVIILRRGAVIAISSLLSVGGALFLHALFAGLFVWSAWFPWARHQGDGKTNVGDPDSGGSPIAVL